MENIDIENLKRFIVDVPDFPKKGIIFKDITPLLGDPVVTKESVKYMAAAFADKKIDSVAGVEARGFIFGALVASVLGAGFIPIRKSGKLPGATISTSYELEYGKESLEIHKNSINSNKKRVLIVDDVLATGGTSKAAADLVEKSGGKVIGYSFLIELENLNGRRFIEHDLVSSMFVF